MKALYHDPISFLPILHAEGAKNDYVALAAQALSDHRHHPVHAVAGVRTGYTVLNGSHNAKNYG